MVSSSFQYGKSLIVTTDKEASVLLKIAIVWEKFLLKIFNLLVLSENFNFKTKKMNRSKLAKVGAKVQSRQKECKVRNIYWS